MSWSCSPKGPQRHWPPRAYSPHGSGTWSAPFLCLLCLIGAAPPAGNLEKHNRHLHEFRDDESTNVMGYLVGSRRGEAQTFVSCSALGLVRVYNHLLKSIVEGATTVCQFQSFLQDLVKQRAAAGHDDWQLVLSPRVSWRHHPLGSLA